MKKRIQATIFGPQGSGKTTQGQLLADWFGVPCIGAGDMCRQEIAENTSLGNLVRPYVERGMLAPDGMVDAIMAKQLKQQSLERGFILDGYPRNIEQAENFEKLYKLNLAIHLKLTDQDAVTRLSGRIQCTGCRAVFHETATILPKPGICPMCHSALQCRMDDREDIIRIRLAEYHFMTEPLAAFYRQKGVLLSIKADQPIIDLFEELTKKMAKLGFKNEK